MPSYPVQRRNCSCSSPIHAFPSYALCTYYLFSHTPVLQRRLNGPSISISRPFRSVPSVSATPQSFLGIWSSTGRGVFFETALPHPRFSKAQEWPAHIYILIRPLGALCQRSAAASPWRRSVDSFDIW